MTQRDNRSVAWMTWSPSMRSFTRIPP